MKIFRHSRQFRKHFLVLSALILLGLSFLSAWYFDSTLSMGYQQNSLQRYIISQQKDAQALLADTALMGKLVRHQETPEEFQRLIGKKYGFFLFAETLGDTYELLFWNTQKIIHSKVDFYGADSIHFRQLLNGFYIEHKVNLELPGMTNRKMAHVMIPVMHKYYLETENSRTTFTHDRYAVRRIAIAERQTAFPIRSIDGTVLFYVEQINADAPSVTDPVTIVFRVTALLLLLLAVHLQADNIVQRRGAVSGILFLAACLLVVRLLLYFLPGVFGLRQIPIFNPVIYGSGLLNRSLGELLINAVLVCWLTLFAWFRLGPIRRLPTVLKGAGIVIAGVAAIFLLLFITFQLASLVNSLLVDSTISFDVTDYARLTQNTWFSFLVLAILSLSYYYFSQILFRFIRLAFPNLFYLYFTVAAAGLILLTFRQDHTLVLFYLPVLAWLVFYTLLLTQEQSIINRFRITIAGLLFWIFLFSVSLAALIMQGNREREKILRKSIARKQDEQSDPSKHKTLSITAHYLDNRFLENNFHRFYREPDNLWIRDSITNTNFGEYNRTYNTSIYIFDGDRNPVNNYELPDTYEELNNIFSSRGRPMVDSIPDIVYYESSPTRFVYLIRRYVYRNDDTLGSMFLVATPKQFYGREPFYPDIFTTNEGRANDPSLTTAVYRENVLYDYQGNYPFTVRLSPNDIPVNEFEERENRDFTELWYKVNRQKVIVVARKKETFIESITLFSYLFCAFLAMVGAIRFFELCSRIVRTWPRVDLFSRLSIQSQIHVTIIFISVFSFIIIGVATISYFIQRNRRENVEMLYTTANNTLDEIQKQARQVGIPFDNTTLSDSASRLALARLVQDISDVHGRIVNIYDTTGALQISSDNKIYMRGVMSTKMDPVAFYHLKSLGQVQKVQDESLSELRYMSIYKIIRNRNGREASAFLNIPHFGSQIKTNQEISNFLITIINLNAFIFLIAGIIALFISNRITRSFSVIGDKMKAITLGRTNEEIEWNKSDEIGELVNQYNKMVQQLEESASALAKSEREGAWREMARQVAHEIKNPLTPMKLSIQYLQKAIQNNQPNVKDLTTNVANTLIEQIDHLSKIAADFSQFANIGNKRVEDVDIHHVISSLLDLYATNPKVEVTWNPVLIEAIMRVDKTQMNRLFTNLLTNAVDACSEREKCTVVISEQLAGDDLLISVADNGDGIPAEMRSKIFTPNFTTKTSGTGLGLAMCKGIVEQAGGSIWFETNVGVGTTFFVRLPLIVPGETEENGELSAGRE